MNGGGAQDALVGLAVAIGSGLLIGIERERRKGQGDRRAAAGLRTFAVAALAGALAHLLPADGLVPLGAALIAALAAISHWRSRSPDPGMTTELALFAARHEQDRPTHPSSPAALRSRASPPGCRRS